MPELPDITLYVDHLEKRLLGEKLLRSFIKSPNLLRTVTPPMRAANGKKVFEIQTLGKRIILSLEDDLFLVFHLMIAGRFRWREGEAKLPGKGGLAVFEFSSGTLLLTEVSKKKRASLHVLKGGESLASLDPGGLDVLAASLSDFQNALTRENRTLKRALTNPHSFSGIGNAYSDEILHKARLSPLKQTKRLAEMEVKTLFGATQQVLQEWIKRLREEAGDNFPEKVTAFREGMAVHGRFHKPCPVCETSIQRVRFADNEMNYCPRCQTGGKLLADRAFSRLLKSDWPKTIEELES